MKTTLKTFVRLSFFAVLVFTFSALTIHDAYANFYDIKDPNTCAQLSSAATWNSDKCILTGLSSSITLNSGDSLVVEPGITLVNNGATITIKSGATITVNFKGTIENRGTINNHGDIYNFGGTSSSAGIRISTINNFGTINNLGTIHNNAISFTTPPSVSDPYGIINNHGIIDNSNIIKNFGGTINNLGGIFNSGTITNTHLGTMGTFTGGEYCGPAPMGYQATGTLSCPLSSITIKAVSPFRSIDEGNLGDTHFDFTVTRSGSLLSKSFESHVDYETEDGTAVSPIDYAQNSATLIFAKDETTKTITILVHGDTTIEPNEHFKVKLTNCDSLWPSSPSFPSIKCTIVNSSVEGEITNDDTPSLPSTPPSFTAVRDGNWNDFNTWDGGVIPSSFDRATIPSGITVTIPQGLTVTIGSGIFILSGGTLTNNGLIDNFGIIPTSGTINNNFIIHNGDHLQKFPGTISIEGTGKIFNNEFGTINNDAMGKIFLLQSLPGTNAVGQISNAGIIKNDGTISSWGHIYNADTINNAGEIDSAGLIANTKTGTGTTHNGYIDNSGTINNFLNVNNQYVGGKIVTTFASTIKNSGTINNNAGTIKNTDASIITNTNTITNVGGTIENYCPSVINPMTVSAGNAIINFTCPIQLDAALMAWLIMLSTIVLTVAAGMFSIRGRF